MLLRKGQYGLQTKYPDSWKWVFCNNNGKIITTEYPRKAVPATAITYFQERFANHEFRVAVIGGEDKGGRNG